MYRRLQDDEQLRETLETGRHGRRMSLKRAQWKAAQDGNVAMLIWLGKNELGQREPERRPAAEVASDFSVEQVQAARWRAFPITLQRLWPKGQSLEDVAKLIKENQQRLAKSTQKQEAQDANGAPAADYDMPPN